MMTFSLLAPFFPYDPALDSAMGHRHLLLGYGFTWGIQLAYAAYVVWKWQSREKPSAHDRRDVSK